MTSAASGRAQRWDVFCRVVDNFGDAAICWRLARQLAREHRVRPRLWIDAPATLAALNPSARPGRCVDGVAVEAWDEADPRLAASTADDVADVVIAALAAEPPAGYRAAMRARRCAWVRLEHLSAERWIETHHGLPSPKPDGLVEHWFFPGFADASGGLLREHDLLERRDAFQRSPAARDRFLASLGVRPEPGSPLASLFCYRDAPVRALLDAFEAADPRWRVLLPAGVAADLGAHPVAVPVPFVAQDDFDRLLWSCDLNLVRGEDSIVRALWSGRPVVWQAYRQADAAHLPKVHAWLASWQARAAAPRAALAAYAALHDAWNDVSPAAGPRVAATLAPALAALPGLRAAAARWVGHMATQDDLARRLVAFVGDRL